MKSKKTNNKLTLAFGGKPMNTDFPSESVSKIKKTTEDALFGSMYDPTVMGLKGLGSTLTKTGMSMIGSGMAGAGDMSGMGGFLQDNMGTIGSIVGGLNTAGSMASGGKAGQVPINAEGGEVIETPGGMPQELIGPSHTGGGIDMNVPSGTEVYSDRLVGQDGNTMADRKKLREKEIARMQKLLVKDPTNKTLKNTLNKIKSNNDTLDQKDISQMEFVRQLTGSIQKMATGGLTYPGGTDDYDEILANDYDPLVFNNPLNNITRTGVPQLESYMYNTPNVGLPQEGSQNLGLGNLFGNLTTGDALGLAGNAISAFGPLKNTIRQREGEVPEQNFYKNFGQNALNIIQDQYGVLDGIKDNQFQDIELSRNATIRRNNNSARGLNTQRALNLATDSSVNNIKGNLTSQFASQKLGIMGQEANQLNSMDEATMRGEESRAEKEVRNRDNFFSNMSKDIANLGTGISTIGKNVNQVKQRETTDGLMQSLYNNFYFDTNTGKWVFKNNNSQVNIDNSSNQLNLRK